MSALYNSWDEVISDIDMFEDELVDVITNAFPDPVPYITTNIFPATFSDAGGVMAEYEKDAKMRANEAHANIVIYVTYEGKGFGERKLGNLYKPQNIFTIILFSNDKRSHKGLYKAMKIVTEALYRSHYTLLTDAVKPTKSETTGLYLAIIQAGKDSVYPLL